MKKTFVRKLGVKPSEKKESQEIKDKQNTMFSRQKISFNFILFTHKTEWRLLFWTCSCVNKAGKKLSENNWDKIKSHLKLRRQTSSCSWVKKQTDGEMFSLSIIFFSCELKKKGQENNMYMHETEGKQSFYLFSIQSTKNEKCSFVKKKSEQQNVVSKKKRTCENWWEKHLRRKFVLFHTWKREKSGGGKRRESVKAKRIFSRRKQTCELRKNVLRKMKCEKKINDKKVILFKCVKTEWK